MTQGQRFGIPEQCMEEAKRHNEADRTFCSQAVVSWRCVGCRFHDLSFLMSNGSQCLSLCKLVFCGFSRSFAIVEQRCYARRNGHRNEIRFGRLFSSDLNFSMFSDRFQVLTFLITDANSADVREIRYRTLVIWKMMHQFLYTESQVLQILSEKQIGNSASQK